MNSICEPGFRAINAAAPRVILMRFNPAVGPNTLTAVAQAVGRDRIWRNHRDETVVGQPDAGVWAHDVRVANAVEFDVLEHITRGGQGRVSEAYEARGRSICHIEGCDPKCASPSARAARRQPPCRRHPKSAPAGSRERATRPEPDPGA